MLTLPTLPEIESMPEHPRAMRLLRWWISELPEGDAPESFPMSFSKYTDPTTIGKEAKRLIDTWILQPDTPGLRAVAEKLDINGRYSPRLVIADYLAERLTSAHDHPDEIQAEREEIERVRLQEIAEFEAMQKAAEEEAERQAFLREYHAPGITPLEVPTPEELAARPPSRWRAKGMVREGWVIVTAGPPGAGKSLLALYAMIAGATGTDFAGEKVEPFRSLYYCGEGMEDTKLRLAAAVDVYGYDPELIRQNIGTRSTAMSLMNPDHVSRVVQEVKVGRYDAVFFDTLSHWSGGADERSPTDMRDIFSDACQRIRRARPGVCVVLIHHTTKSGDDYRGDSTISGNSDATILAKGKLIKGVRLTTEDPHAKLRNGKPFTIGNFVSESWAQDDDIPVLYYDPALVAKIGKSRPAAHPADADLERVKAILADGKLRPIEDVGGRAVERQLKRWVEDGELARTKVGRAFHYSLAAGAA